MNKLIAKTAAITFGTLLALTLIVYFCFALFAPLKLCEFYNGVGSGSLSLKYAERAYEKDETDDNLLLVIRRSIAAKNADKTAEYCEKLFKNVPIGLTADETVYYQIKYCTALYDLDKPDRAVNVAVGFSQGFLPGNALENLAAYGLEKNDEKLLKDILTELKLMSDFPDMTEENRARLKTRIGQIGKYLNMVPEHD